MAENKSAFSKIKGAMPKPLRAALAATYYFIIRMMRKGMRFIFRLLRPLKARISTSNSPLIKKIKNRMPQKLKDKLNRLIGNAPVAIPRAKRNPLKTVDLKSQTSKRREKRVFAPPKVGSLKDIRVAAIMDDFTYQSYAPECNLMSVSIDNWKAEMDEFKPHLFFLESAWRGKDDGWTRKVSGSAVSDELLALTAYCHKKGIPVIFWNKEDPVYTEHFLAAAKQADYVFTTDIDCVKRYKRDLLNDNVHFLHFAAQPKYHNPVECYDRKDKFCFAGAYYHKYAERCKVFDAFYEVIKATKGIDIYDRNYPDPLPEHAFPEQYNKDILGKLPYTEIDKAYKGYTFGINMNSVTKSQTMFARRVFELLASNTVVVGNYSRGVKNLLGDLTICTDSEKILSQKLNEYCADMQSYRKYRLLGLRRTLSEHLYADRFNFIVKTVFGVDMLSKNPEVCVAAFCNEQEQLEKVVKSFERQNYKNKKLVVVTNARFAVPQYAKVISRDEADETDINKLGEFVAIFNPDDYYGKNYLIDIMLTYRYSSAQAVGKACSYAFNGSAAVVESTEGTYKPAKSLVPCRSVVNTAAYAQCTLAALENGTLEGELFACDEFNYCADLTAESCEAVDDMVLENTGMLMSEIGRTVDNIVPDNEESLTLVDLESMCGGMRPSSSGVFYRMENGSLIINNTQDSGRTVMVHCLKTLDVAECTSNGKIKVNFIGQGNAAYRVYCIFYDKKGRTVAHYSKTFNITFAIVPPEGADFFILAVGTREPGEAVISFIAIGESENFASAYLLSNSKTLILTNNYPSREKLYSNMFVHKRVAAYINDGLECEVARIRENIPTCAREFDGVNVIEGNSLLLNNVLQNSIIDTVCVHFLDRNMWDVLKEHKDRLRIIIWSHGADIQPWWRRSFIYTDDEALKRAKELSEERMELWNEVFAEILSGANISMVFVSNYQAHEVMEDYNVDLPEGSYNVIHNCIDTEEFSYQPKDAEQRKKILSIKSFSTRNYANDITSDAIVELSKRPIFKDLTFDIYGDGVLFDECTRDIKDFENVNVYQCFMPHDEIARLHKNHGVYIATTRSDTQGVSRDEAMSSGMVAIATAVTAVPEFADDGCAVMVPNDDPVAVADAIEKLYNDPGLFLELSQKAAARVRSQTSKEYTIDNEIKLIKGMY